MPALPVIERPAAARPSRMALLAMPLLLAVATAQPAAAQAPPALPSSIVAANAPLSSRDRETVSAYVAHWSGVLASGDPTEVSRARGELANPARSPSATPIFLRGYADEVLPAVMPVVEGGDTFRAINALQVLRFLRTPESVDAIVARCDQRREPLRGKRQVAASLLKPAIAAASLNPAQLDGISRQIGAVAGAESDWMILLQLLRSLEAIAAQPGLPPASVELARSSLIAAIQSTVSRLGGANGDPSLIEALHRTLISMREQYVRLSGSQRSEFSRQMTPVLESIRAAASSGGSSAPANLRSAFAETEQIAGQLLALMKG